MTMEKLNAVDGVIFANTTGDPPFPTATGSSSGLRPDMPSSHALLLRHLTGSRRSSRCWAAEFLTHDAQVGISAINQDPSHPAKSPWDPPMTSSTEIYQFKSFDRSRFTACSVWMRIPNYKFPGDYPVAWCKQVGKGRVPTRHWVTGRMSGPAQCTNSMSLGGIEMGPRSGAWTRRSAESGSHVGPVRRSPRIQVPV